MWTRWRRWVKENIQTTSDSLAVTIVIIVALGLTIIMQGLWAESVKSELHSVREAYANILQNCP